MLVVAMTLDGYPGLERFYLPAAGLTCVLAGAAVVRRARQAVRESLVLLKNERKALPLSKTAKRIHVAGRSADRRGASVNFSPAPNRIRAKYSRVPVVAGE